MVIAGFERNEHLGPTRGGPGRRQRHPLGVPSGFRIGGAGGHHLAVTHNHRADRRQRAHPPHPLGGEVERHLHERSRAGRGTAG